MNTNTLYFSYNGERCHAIIVDALPEKNRYVGRFGEHEIYYVGGIIFDQFGFVAIKR